MFTAGGILRKLGGAVHLTTFPAPRQPDFAYRGEAPCTYMYMYIHVLHTFIASLYRKS